MIRRELTRPQLKRLVQIKEATDASGSCCATWWAAWVNPTERVLITLGLVDRIDERLLCVTEKGQDAVARRGVLLQERKNRTGKPFRLPWTIYHEPSVPELDDDFCTARPTESYQVEAGSIAGDALLFVAWER